MQEREIPSFEDPELKAAFKRALPAENAPVSLRNRVQKMLDDAPSPRVTANRSFWRQPLMGLATAAAILLCMGTGLWYWEGNRNIAQTGSMPALPVAFAQDLVTTHDECCSLPDHHFLKGVPDDDFRLMTQKLREQLGFPALAAAAGDGWKFYGASASCMVGPAHSAHLVFKQDAQSLSLFSVAVSSEAWPSGRPPTEGQRFENMQTGHAIMSWVHDDTVYSVVGASKNGPLDIHQIAPIADHLRVALGDSNPDMTERTTVAFR